MSLFDISVGFKDAAALNLFPGLSRAGAFGYCPDIDIGTVPEDVWTLGGRYPWIGTPAAMQVRSTHAEDNPSGAGAATVLLSGLNSGRYQVPQSLTLNGTTPVSIPQNPFRINGASVTSMGAAVAATALLGNLGDIIFEDVVGGTVRAIIPASYGTTRQAQFTVPTGFTLLIPQILLDVKPPSGVVGTYARISTWFKTLNGVIRQPIEFGTTSAQPYAHYAEPGIMALAGTDVSLLVTQVSDNNSSITAAWNGVLKVN